MKENEHYIYDVRNILYLFLLLFHEHRKVGHKFIKIVILLFNKIINNE